MGVPNSSFGSVWGCQTAVSEGHKNRSQCGQGATGDGLSRRERPSEAGTEALQRGFGSSKQQFRKVIKTAVRPRRQGVRGLPKQALRRCSEVLEAFGGAA